MKVIVNGCYGGPSLSYQGAVRYYDLLRQYRRMKDAKDIQAQIMYGVEPEGCPAVYFPDGFEIGYRRDPVLMQVIEELGTIAASGYHAYLCIADVPDDVNWQISDYDGMEHVEEIHRKWYGASIETPRAD